MPLGNVDSFNAPHDLAEREAEEAQHRHDAYRHENVLRDPRPRAVVLRELLETADRNWQHGILSDRRHALLVADVEEELAALEARGLA